MVEIKSPRSKTRSQNIETSVCKPLVEEYAHRAHHFRGEDGRGGVLIVGGDDFYRVDCGSYIRKHEHEFPKPDKL